MDVFLEVSGRSHIPPKDTVSILVLLDVFLEGFHSSASYPAFTVSILVLLDVFLEVFCHGLLHPGVIVSILVLLDVFLEGLHRYGLGKPDRVSILVLLDVFLEAARPYPRLPARKFQSLFSWMFFSKFRMRLKNAHTARVSILVLLDVFLEANVLTYCFNRAGVSILVLLDVFLEEWPASWNRIRASKVSILVLLDVFLEELKEKYEAVKKTGSFNPCSLGCFSRSSLIRPRILKRSEFQSLFSWMFFSKFPMAAAGRLDTGVSILVLLDVFLEAPNPPSPPPS